VEHASSGNISVYVISPTPTPKPSPTPECIKYGPDILRGAQSHGIDPLLLAAIAAQETGGPASDSGNNIDAKPPNQGHGIFQIDAGSWPDQVKLGVADNPAQAAGLAASIIASALNAHNQDVTAALHDYNAGWDQNTPTTNTTWPDGTVLNYQQSVLRHLARLKKHHADLSCGTP
jgi:soluble lytic murein transglycosylase-like protein